jgi:hypothetical protein
MQTNREALKKALAIKGDKAAVKAALAVLEGHFSDESLAHTQVQEALKGLRGYLQVLQSAVVALPSSPVPTSNASPEVEKKVEPPQLLDLFDEYCEESREVMKAKNHDYAGDEQWANFRMWKQSGNEEWTGVVCRMSDKMSRLLSFVKQGNVKNESIEDTFRDMFNYSFIGATLFKELSEENAKDVNWP